MIPGILIGNPHGLTCSILFAAVAQAIEAEAEPVAVAVAQGPTAPSVWPMSPVVFHYPEAKVRVHGETDGYVVTLGKGRGVQDWHWLGGVVYIDPGVDEVVALRLLSEFCEDTQVEPVAITVHIDEYEAQYIEIRRTYFGWRVSPCQFELPK